MAGGYLLGLDCRPAAIERARAGWFNASTLEGLSPALRTRYFQEEGGGYRAMPILRQTIHWTERDAFTRGPLAAWDLCRNLAIYLEAPAATGLRVTFMAALRPQGVLVVGKAEQPTGDVRMTRLAPCVYGREGGWR